jgi:type VI secretion system protein ImpM
MNVATASNAPGWFGKLSCLGDFAHRRLTPEWVRGCDDWLSRCLAHSQAQRGTGWLPTYLAAPVWRFAWGPQVADAQWWFGLLMPSCDSVGRYFPLVLAQPRALPPDDRFGFAHLELWWQHLTQSALATLADGASVDAFESQLADAPPWPAVPASGLKALPVSGAHRWSVPAAGSVADLAHALAAESLRERLVGQTLWWPWRPDGEPDRCTLVPGLPPPALFDEMLGSA